MMNSATRRSEFTPTPPAPVGASPDLHVSISAISQTSERPGQSVEQEAEEMLAIPDGKRSPVFISRIFPLMPPKVYIDRKKKPHEQGNQQASDDRLNDWVAFDKGFAGHATDMVSHTFFFNAWPNFTAPQVPLKEQAKFFEEFCPDLSKGPARIAQTIRLFPAQTPVTPHSRRSPHAPSLRRQPTETSCACPDPSRSPVSPLAWPCNSSFSALSTPASPAASRTAPQRRPRSIRRSDPQGQGGAQPFNGDPLPCSF